MRSVTLMNVSPSKHTLILYYLKIYSKNFHIKRWWTSEWEDCSGTCLNGGKGFRKRTVLCITRNPDEHSDHVEIKAVSEIECLADLRPLAIEPCEIDLKTCNYEPDDTVIPHWIAEEWTRV